MQSRQLKTLDFSFAQLVMAVTDYETHFLVLSLWVTSSYSMKTIIFVLAYLLIMADIAWSSWALRSMLICEKMAPPKSEHANGKIMHFD